MQKNDTTTKLMRFASLLLLVIAASELFIPFEQPAFSLPANELLLISAALAATVIYSAKPLNDILIQHAYFPEAATFFLLIASVASIALGLPNSTDASFLLEVIALSFSVVSHTSIIQNVAFRRQMATINIGIIGGLLIFGLAALLFRIYGITFNHLILVSVLLAFQTAISIACRRKQEPSPLQLPASESGKLRDSAVHFGAPLADGFLLGFLPASLFVTHASINVLALALMLALGCLLLFASKRRTPHARKTTLGVESPEQTQKRHAGFFKVIPIALSIFLGMSATVDSLLVGLHLFVYAWYFSLLCSSLTERGQFLNISIFFILGKFGATFALGFLISSVVCCLPVFFGAETLLANELRVVLGVIFIEGFCIVSTRKGTMLDAIEEATQSDKTVAESDEKQHIRWRDRVDAVAAAYDLTSRQQEVFLHLAKGRNAQFIADELCVSLPTAKSHIYNIYVKLGVHSRQELLDLVDSSAHKSAENTAM